MPLLEKYRWEATHITVIAGVIATLALGSRVLGISPDDRLFPFPELKLPSPAAVTPPSAPPFHPVPAPSQQSADAPQQSDLHQITVGPSGISNRYTLLSVNRRTAKPNSDELIIGLHVESLATDPLVSPFGSDMLDIESPARQPITPNTAFHQPIPSGESRNRDITFNIPANLILNQATLRIHYYNYESEIPLTSALEKAAK